MSSSACIESANGHDSDGELPGTPAISEHSRPVDSALHGPGSHFERHLGPSSSGEIPPVLSSDDGFGQHHAAKGRSRWVSFDDGCSSPLGFREPSQDGSQPDAPRLDGLLPAGKAGPQAKVSQVGALNKAGDKPTAASSTGAEAAGAGLSVRPRRSATEAHEQAPNGRQQEHGKPEASVTENGKSEHGDAADPVRKAMDDAITQAVMLLDIGPAAGEDTIEHIAEVGSGAP